MLMMMVALFTICWMPLHIFFLILDFKQQILENLPQYQANYLYFFVFWLAMSNSFQNPIIYGFMNENFRVSLFGMLLLAQTDRHAVRCLMAISDARCARL